MKVGIVGCGLIGGKRADALAGTEDRLVGTFDLVPERARALAGKHKAEACATLEELVAKSDAVVVATTNDQLRRAVDRGRARRKARRRREARCANRQGARAARRAGARKGRRRQSRLQSPLPPRRAEGARAFSIPATAATSCSSAAATATAAASATTRSGAPIPARAAAGSSSTRACTSSTSRAGFSAPSSTDVQGRVETYFWKMPVDDNAFLTLGTAARQVAHLQVSCTEWKNMFSLEIYARHAKLHWEGLGGSYGPERLYPLRDAPRDGTARRGHLRVRAVRQVVGARVAGLRTGRPRQDAPVRRRRGRPRRPFASSTAFTVADSESA